MLCQTGNLSDLNRQGFIAQPKDDGTRVLIIKENGQVTLQNRHGVDYTRRLLELTAEAKALPEDNFTLDGEAVYINPKTGKTEFTGSQRRCSTQFPDLLLRRQFPITFKAFDLLTLNGEDMTDREWRRRDQALQSLLTGRQTIQWVPHRTDLQAFFEEVKHEQEEGIILKDVHSRYEHERSYSWLKVKNWRFDIYSVIGYTQGKGSRRGLFGSLVLAKNGRYCGCVGSGFNDWTLRQVKDILSDAPQVNRPFDIGDHYTAIKTDLTVKVKYYKLTENGNNVMRFPVFIEVV